MEKASSWWKGGLSFLVGGAMAVGAGLLMSKVCKRNSQAGQKTGFMGNAAQSGNDAYCDVPEGADICYPG